MKYISLFAGIGGFDLALNRQGHECVYVNEWDKYAAQIYEKNFNHKPDTRDITTVNAGELPDFDLLCGGFPCQAFSIAGKRGGFNETRGTLFFDIARILKERSPRLCLLENVKGLLSHDNGRTFKVILTTLTELGYDVQWQVLNSKNFGVPQNRERVFIIGHLRGTARPQVFPIQGDASKDNGQIVSTALDANYWKGIDNHGQRTAIAVAPTIRATEYKHGDNQTLVARTVRSGGRSSPHGSKQNWDSYEFDGKIRRLTPIECERLQGLPDRWTEGVSDTQRYKTLGNAVTVNVVEAIVKRLDSPTEI